MDEGEAASAMITEAPPVGQEFEGHAPSGATYECSLAAADQALASIKPAPLGSSPLEAVTDDQLLMIYFLFGNNLEKAMHILDNRGVTRVTANPSGRVIFKVLADSRNQTEYTCFPDEFCSCASFQYDIVYRGQQLCCKHQLAARLAISLNIFRESTVSDEQLALVLSNI